LLSLTWLMVYLGISTVTGASFMPRLARQARRELQAPRLVEEVVLLLGRRIERLVAPRTITWHVVQAQLFSHACSISMPLASSVSQMEVPGVASISLAFGTENFVRQHLADRHS
jgi:hypothetical protein